ncbi:MAG: substrate-binding domain-containing protein [Fusobacteriaceae bacterium]|jgi:LacI family transcriptional regulator|nr:substrate-binding domain-containing protein [Fusobacteriaceae bacterium]
MSKERITLKDLSKASGYSITSVHRAISHKEGISDSVRNEILDIADKMGYVLNYLASSLKKDPIKIALVMPTPTSYGNYYQYILKGCQDLLQEVSVFNCRMISRFSEINGNDEKSQLDILNNIYNEYQGTLDGLIVAPVKNTVAIKNSLGRFIAKKVSVLLIDNEFKDIKRLCCISPNDQMTGQLGAEFLCGMQPKPGTILVAKGDKESLSHVYNLQGFSKYIKKYELPYKILEIDDDINTTNFFKNTMSILKKRTDIVALYTVRARNTIPLCQAAIKSNLVGKLKIVGSDLFPESAKALEDGILNGIIYKNPYQKGYIGMKTIFDYLVKGENPISSTKKVQISVILKSNLRFFKDII